MVELPGAVVDSGDLERDSLHAIGEDDEVLVPASTATVTRAYDDRSTRSRSGPAAVCRRSGPDR